MTTIMQPALFLSHGSPMTALGGDELNAIWQRLSRRLTRPEAIIVVSAHWTTRLPLVTGSAKPETIHDFGGFPAELYEMQYPAPGSPTLAQTIKQRLTQSGLATGIDASRGIDHGVWVPMMALFQGADVPIVQLSVQPERCARHHYAVGAALAELRRENIMVVASGHMTHNLMEYMRGVRQPSVESMQFRNWVHERILLAGKNDEALEELFNWQEQAPGAKAAHPTPEHFLPLFVALGAAGEQPAAEWVGGGWIEHTLAADNYAFGLA